MSTGQKFTSTTRHDPYRNYNYEVTFSGFKSIFGTGWSYVSGIKVQNNFKEYREGGNNGVADHIHDGTIYEPILMERGMSEDTSIVEAFAGQYDSGGKGILNKNRWTVTIHVKDRNNKVVKKLTLTEVSIIGFETGDLVGVGQEVYINRMTIRFLGVDISNSAR